MLRIAMFLGLFALHFTASAAELSSTDTEARLDEARRLIDSGEYGDARKILLKLDPAASSRVNLYLGFVHDPVYQTIKNERIKPKRDRGGQKKAVAHYQQAVDQGSCAARYHLLNIQTNRHFRHMSKTVGNHHLPGQFVVRLNTLAECSERDAAAGDLEALFILIETKRLAQGKSLAQVADLLSRLREKAQAGDRNAQYYLGLLYTDGYINENDQNDPLEAFAWFAAAASQKHALAAQFLSFLYEFEIKKDDLAEANQRANRYIQNYADPSKRNEK